MARHKQLDVEEIIAKNPKISRVDLEKGVEVLKALQRSGVVRPSTYDLETADRNKKIRYSEEEIYIVRGTTIRIAK
jgi:uridine kinase